MKPIQILGKTFILATLSVLAATQSFADPNPAPSPSATEPGLAYQNFYVLNPPVAGSFEDLEDMAQILHLQDIRTSAQCAQAQIESTLTFENEFGPETGVLTEAEVQLASVIAVNVFTEVANVTGYYKNVFKRNRPYVQNPNVIPCVTLPGGYSYPSTHSTTAYTMALVLSDLFPAKAALIMQQGFQVGEDREIGGVHFPSDVAMGRALAGQIYQYLKNNPAPVAVPTPNPSPAPVAQAPTAK